MASADCPVVTDAAVAAAPGARDFTAADGQGGPPDRRGHGTGGIVGPPSQDSSEPPAADNVARDVAAVITGVTGEDGTIAGAAA